MKMHRPVRVDTGLFSTQHDPDVSNQQIQCINKVIKEVDSSFLA